MNFNWLTSLPPLLLDLSGAFAVLVSLYFLFAKARAYWHWSNASLLPYFLLFVGGGQWMLAGLQVTYLLFGIHGLYLWHLEARRDRGELSFNEPLWYGVTWVASLAIFAFTTIVTDFSQPWNWVQFAAVTLALSPTSPPPANGPGAGRCGSRSTRCRRSTSSTRRTGPCSPCNSCWRP